MKKLTQPIILKILDWAYEKVVKIAPFVESEPQLP
jgi:hypothetical protein